MWINIYSVLRRKTHILIVDDNNSFLSFNLINTIINLLRCGLSMNIYFNSEKIRLTCKIYHKINMKMFVGHLVHGKSNTHIQNAHDHPILSMPIRSLHY